MRLAIFLFCVGFASAVPLQTRDVDLDDNVSPHEIGKHLGSWLKAEFDKIGGKVKEIFEAGKHGNLLQKLHEEMDPKAIKGLIENVYEKGGEIMDLLKETGEKHKSKIVEWLDKLSHDRQERAISKTHSHLKEFFKSLHLDLKKRYTKFGEWVKEKCDKEIEKGGTREENLKKIAKEFIADKNVRKGVAMEALGFFGEYKQDLAGKLYDKVVSKVAKVLKD